MGQLVLVGWYLCQSWIVPMRNARGAPPFFSGHTVSTSSCFAGLQICRLNCVILEEIAYAFPIPKVKA